MLKRASNGHAPVVHTRLSVPADPIRTIVAEIEVRQRCTLHQHSCEPLCILSFHFTEWQFECADAVPDYDQRELPENELQLPLCYRTIVGVAAQVLHQSSAGMVPRAAAKASAARNGGCVSVACLVVLVHFFCTAGLSRMLAFLCCASPLSLFSSASV